MNARYSLLHFLPDPAVGTRLPIAALVERDGSIRVARAKRIPGAECLGSVPAANLLLRILDSLDSCTRLDCLPTMLGPQVLLGPTSNIPADLKIDDAVSWVSKHVLPCKASSSPRGERAEPLAETGYRFLTQFKVARFVHKSFHPEKLWSNTAWSSVAPISHWVKGPTELLLMEPVSVLQPIKLDKLLSRLSTKLAAYRWKMETAPPNLDVKLYAYILPGGSSEARQRAQLGLGDTTHCVYDCASIPQRTKFLAEIKNVGQNGHLLD